MISADGHVSFTLSRESYGKGETVQATITLVDPARALETKDIKIRDQAGVVVNVAPFLLDLHDHSFLYFDLPLDIEEGTYTLNLEALSFVVNGTLVQETHSTTFLVDVHQPRLAIRPGGVVITDDIPEFQVRLTSISETTNVTINAPEWISHPYQSGQVVTEGTTRFLRFVIDRERLPSVDVVGSLVLSYGNAAYDVPLYFYATTAGSDDGTRLEIVNDVRSINRTLRQDQTLQGEIVFSNTGDETLSLTLVVDGSVAPYVSTTLDRSSLAPSQDAALQVLVNPFKNAPPGTYSGFIRVGDGISSLIIPVTIAIASLDDRTFTVVGPSPDEPSDQEPQQTFRILDPLNYTQPPVEERNVRGVGLSITILLLVLVAVLYYLSRKKLTTTKDFGEYIRDVEKKR